MTDPQHKSEHFTSSIRETWDESKWCLTVDRSVLWGSWGARPCVSVPRIPHPLLDRHKSGTPPPLPLPLLATEPNVEQSKLTLHPHPFLSPYNRLSWHDGGYVLILQASATCLICWKVKLRLWNVNNSLCHIGKSKGRMVPFWLVSWVTFSDVHAYPSMYFCVWMKVSIFAYLYLLPGFSQFCIGDWKKYFSSSFTHPVTNQSDITLNITVWVTVSKSLSANENIVTPILADWKKAHRLKWVQCPPMAGRYIPVRPPGACYGNTWHHLVGHGKSVSTDTYSVWVCVCFIKNSVLPTISAVSTTTEKEINKELKGFRFSVCFCI